MPRTPLSLPARALRGLLPGLLALAVVLSGVLSSSATGAVAGSDSRASHSVSGAIATLYRANRAAMGSVTGAERATRGGTWQRFSRGNAYARSGKAHFVPHGTPITAKYRQINAEHSIVGFPRTDQKRMDNVYRGASYQRYQHGTIVASDRGAFVMQGGIEAQWATSSFLKVPTADVRTHSRGSYQLFVGGIVYTSKAGRTASIANGVLRAEYNRQGAEWGALGFPRSGAYAPISGRAERQQNFDHGAIVASGSRARSVYGPIFEAWKGTGYATGTLGLPTSAISCGQSNNGCFQHFERGVIQWAEPVGATVRRGATTVDQRAFFTATQRACFGGATLLNATGCQGVTAAIILSPSVAARAGDTSDAYACYTHASLPSMVHCRTGTPGAPFRIAVVGNCHMAGLQPMFTELARQRRIEITPFMAPACLWTTGNDPACRAKYDQQKGALIDRGGFDVVVLHGGSGRPPQEFVSGRINEIAAKNKQVVVIQDNPELTREANDCVSRSSDAQIRRGDCDVTPTEASQHYDYYWNSQLHVTVPNVYYIPTRDLYCNDDVCPAQVGSVLVYRDRIHISVTYSWTIAPEIFRRIGLALNDTRWIGFSRR